MEDLVDEYYQWQGYIVRRNIKVGPLKHGGWAGELDIVAYDPKTEDLIHLEPSIDALSWARREEKFRKKFSVGRKHIFADVFPWLDRTTPLKQVAVLITSGENHRTLADADVLSIDEFMREVRQKVGTAGRMASNAIPEQFGLLRTVQMAECGYYRRLE